MSGILQAGGILRQMAEGVGIAAEVPLTPFIYHARSRGHRVEVTQRYVLLIRGGAREEKQLVDIGVHGTKNIGLTGSGIAGERNHSIDSG